MKAKIIETGEIVNVLPYPTIYQEKGLAIEVTEENNPYK